MHVPGAPFVKINIAREKSVIKTQLLSHPKPRRDATCHLKDKQNNFPQIIDSKTTMSAGNDMVYFCLDEHVCRKVLIKDSEKDTRYEGEKRFKDNTKVTS